MYFKSNKEEPLKWIHQFKKCFLLSPSNELLNWALWWNELSYYSEFPSRTVKRKEIRRKRDRNSVNWIPLRLIPKTWTREKNCTARSEGLNYSKTFLVMSRSWSLKNSDWWRPRKLIRRWLCKYVRICFGLFSFFGWTTS